MLATAIKIGLPLWQRERRWLALGVAALAFLCIAIVRTPLLPTMILLVPLSVWLHGRRARG